MMQFPKEPVLIADSLRLEIEFRAEIFAIRHVAKISTIHHNDVGSPGVAAHRWRRILKFKMFGIGCGRYSGDG